MKLIYSIIIGASIGYTVYWLHKNYSSFMEYATKYPSNTAVLEYLGFMERKTDE